MVSVQISEVPLPRQVNYIINLLNSETCCTAVD
jgi:hypothetical protein